MQELQSVQKQKQYCIHMWIILAQVKRISCIKGAVRKIKNKLIKFALPKGKVSTKEEPYFL